MTARDSTLPGSDCGGVAAGEGQAGFGPCDHLLQGGGAIPGCAGWAAFTLHRPRARRSFPEGAACGPPGRSGESSFAPIPVVIAVPHAGRRYPPGLRKALRHPEEAAMRLEDRLVDVVGEAVARATGAALLVAQAPRALIDLNRASDDIDWGMIAGAPPLPPPGSQPRGASGRRARSGLGLIPRRLPGLGELWRAPLTPAELAARIDQVHIPYHKMLEQVMADLRDRWGAALLIDLHSMPPLGPKGGQERGSGPGSGRGSGPGSGRGADRPADFVLGDRFGAACDVRLVQAALDRLERAGLPHALNRPYAGGYVLDRHGQPQRGLHALQLEICRATYLDASLSAIGPGLAPVVEQVSALVRLLADELLGTARSMAQAAQ